MPRLRTHPYLHFLAATGSGATLHAIPCSEPSPVERKLQESKSQPNPGLRITIGGFKRPGGPYRGFLVGLWAAQAHGGQVCGAARTGEC